MGTAVTFGTIVTTFLATPEVTAQSSTPNTVREQQFRRQWDNPNVDMAVGQSRQSVQMRGNAGVRTDEEVFYGADGNFYNEEGQVAYGYPENFDEADAVRRFQGADVDIVEPTPAELLQQDVERLNSSGPFLWQVQLRVGYAYDSVPDTGSNFTGDEPSESSPFAGLSGLLSYNQSVGQWSVDAAYSAGYRYYFDQDFVTNSQDWGTLNQTLDLDVEFEGNWLRVASSTSASYGQGNDLEAGYNTDRLVLDEVLILEATPGEYNVFGLRLSGRYELYDYEDSFRDQTDLIEAAAALYWQREVSDKTDVRLELSAGLDEQSVGVSSGAGFTQYFYEALVGGNYRPTDKLSFRVGFGATMVEYEGDENILRQIDDNEEVKPLYELGVNYQITGKTALSLEVSQRETRFVPDIALTAISNPLESLTLSLSLYQRSSSSTVIGGADLRTIGIVGSARQSIFESASIGVSGGWESAEYLSAASGDSIDDRNIDDDGYAFGELDFVWHINRRLTYDASIGINSSGPRVNRADDDLEIYGQTSLTFTF